MIISFAEALVLRPLPPERLLLASLALLVHLATFDEIFKKLKASPKRVLPLLGLNALPYALSALIFEVNLWALAVPAALVAADLYLSRMRESPHAYVVGSAIPTATALTVAYFSPEPAPELWLFWYALAVHVIATAAYVESKLPWRSVSPKLGLAIWLFAFPALALEPLLAVAFAEPTVKFLRNALKDGKVSPKELKRLGWREMGRFVLYSALLTAILKTT
ncbi:MAG: hypothetical protein GXO07_02955 [Crenarchaeota archaeon]|nr:hypothetical protein [Thermoproteota archaeon]